MYVAWLFILLQYRIYIQHEYYLLEYYKYILCYYNNINSIYKQIYVVLEYQQFVNLTRKEFSILRYYEFLARNLQYYNQAFHALYQYTILEYQEFLA